MAAPLVEKIANDLKQAIKTKDEFRVSCLRVLKAAVTNEQGRRTEPLKDEDVQAVIQSVAFRGQKVTIRGEARDTDSFEALECETSGPQHPCIPHLAINLPDSPNPYRTLSDSPLPAVHDFSRN